MKKLGGSPSALFALAFYFVCFLGLVQIARAQNGTTIPSQVSALNFIFGEWRLSARSNQWNISGEPCSGSAIDSTTIDSKNETYNPDIKCECDGTTCHITQLKVYALSVVGVIPDVLWTLTSLTNLDLRQNNLRGTLSPAIGNLTRMQYLSFGTNALSGQVPKELGLLTDMRSLSIAANNFSGTLPLELGNLTKLEELYVSSSGVSGAIPSTFASLTNLKIVWASDTNLTSSIPEFIGNWSNLRSLNLSFNNLMGQIPDSLFSLSSLSYLSLGNNKLTGPLPAQKSTSLLNIDLSFNELSGRFPSWIKEQDLQINLVGNNFTISKKNKTGLIVGIAFPVGVVTFLSALASCCIVRRKRRLRRNPDEELLGMDARPCTFSYAELRAATEGFNPANKLGEGGFGPVYKGRLNDGRMVAVKQLSVESNHGKGQFVAEIVTISAVQHRNLVKLFGCCIEGDRRLLVYEYLEKKSLDQALFGKTSLYLNWPIRCDICLGVARGLAYLHEESRLRIVHRDVKASNILLDSDLNPKISDFGLAKLYDDKKTHISTRVAGTFGYLAPEYAMRGHLTEKADVFGFGVLALEIVSGRPNFDSSLEEEKMYLLEWAWQVHENDREVELVDANLSEFNEEEVKRVIGVALLCTQTSPRLRPTMSRAIAMLSGDVEVSSVTSRPEYLTDWKFNDTTNFMISDTRSADKEYSHYTSSTNASTLADPGNLRTNSGTPILREVIGEDR